MSKKDYVAAAAIVRAAAYLEQDAREQLVLELSAWFESDNERFDRQRFREACQPVPRCTTCGRSADDGYQNTAVAECCVDAAHDAYLRPRARAKAVTAREAIERARAAWANTSDQLELA